MKNLCVFLDGRSLLKNISFELGENRALGILGKSGAGKTLLLKSLIALCDSRLKICAESLQIANDSPLNHRNLRSLRKKVGFIFQDARGSFHPLLNIGEIFEMHLKENARFDKNLRDRSLRDRSLRGKNLCDKKERKNVAFAWFRRLNLNDCELLWHSFAHQLSAGIAMRVQIALALSLGAEILLCDEITSALDSANVKNIADIFKALKGEKTLILVSHDVEFVELLSDEIIVLENGAVAENSGVADFFSTPKSEYGKEILQLYKGK
ncbi:ATP-binding cassette domain-containing protein [Helicobacter sp. 23-1045]